MHLEEEEDEGVSVSMEAKIITKIYSKVWIHNINSVISFDWEKNENL